MKSKIVLKICEVERRNNAFHEALHFLHLLQKIIEIKVRGIVAKIT